MKKISINFIVFLEYFSIVGFILFWISFYLMENNNPESSEIFLAHERAFPIPDLGYIVPCLLIGAIGLKKRKSYGLLFSILGASALVFLAVLDGVFSYQQGIFSAFNTDSISYGIIVVLLLLIGILIVSKVWSERCNLIGGE